MNFIPSRSTMLSPGSLLEAVFETGPVAMALLGEGDEILVANQAFAGMLECEPADLAGVHLSAFRDPEDPVAEPGSTVETVLRLKNGELRPFRLTVSRTVDPEAGPVGVALIEDMRACLQRDSERRREAAHQSQVQKYEAVARLTGGIAHDFNNMLTVILANAEMLAGSLGPEASGRADLEELRAAARRGTAMVRKLLGYSRRERLVLQPVNIARLIQELSNHLRGVLPPTIHLIVTADRVADVLVDPNAAEQILLNLLTNSRDAMPDGGQITIHTSMASLDVDHARRHGWGDPGEYVCTTVTDSGTGMEQSVMERLFEPFFTTKPPGLGTGLGMPMIYGLVKQHGGFVKVESRPGAGTTVRIYFRPAGCGTPSTVTVEEQSPAGGTESILLVEDEEPIRRAARRVLERFGYRVTVAADGVEALEILHRPGIRIDLVITDVVMPRLGGRGLYDAVRAEGLPIRFLFASGYTARDVGATGVIDPELPFIHKPWTVGDFVRRVREVLDR